MNTQRVTQHPRRESDIAAAVTGAGNCAFGGRTLPRSGGPEAAPLAPRSDRAVPPPVAVQTLDHMETGVGWGREGLHCSALCRFADGCPPRTPRPPSRTPSRPPSRGGRDWPYKTTPSLFGHDFSRIEERHARKRTEWPQYYYFCIFFFCIWYFSQAEIPIDWTMAV